MMTVAVIIFTILLHGNFWNIGADAKVSVKRLEAGAVTSSLGTEGLEFRLSSFYVGHFKSSAHCTFSL